jgi:thiol-disulfide isomerase/thioredoxin
MTRLYVLLFLFMTFAAHAKLPRDRMSGLWRVTISNKSADVPFLLEIMSDKNKSEIILYNGQERILLPDYNYQNNTLTIQLHTSPNVLELKRMNKKTLIGQWIRNDKTPIQKYQLRATLGHLSRFDSPVNSKPQNVGGKWKINFADEKDHSILLIEQTGHVVHGTVLTKTGDYRYFKGFVDGNKIKLANFDGVFCYLLQAEFKNDEVSGSLNGSSVNTFRGKKDDKVVLPDAYAQTQVESIKFILENLDGKKVSLDEYKNKAVVLQIFGSWCPNCLDEMEFLKSWHPKKPKSVELIGLAFERGSDDQITKKRLQRTLSKREVHYPILVAGLNAEQKPESILPGIKNFISFPTLIFLDKNHQVYKVHAGFSGQGTGEYFENFKKEFFEIIKKIE